MSILKDYYFRMDGIFWYFVFNQDNLLCKTCEVCKKSFGFDCQKHIFYPDKKYVEYHISSESQNSELQELITKKY